MFVVYMHTFPNGKKYVGITSTDVTVRWGLHGNGYQYQPLIWRAIQKYGWSNVQHTILQTDLTREEACLLEETLIKTLNLTDPNFGYNATSGGDHFSHTEESKRKIGQAKLGNKYGSYKRSEETRKKMSEARKGFKWSEAEKEKQRIAQLKRYGKL